MMAFGSRMKNFTDTLMRDVARIYKDLDVDFEPRWFTFFMLLCERDEEITITKIAEELKQSHPAVIQVAHILEEEGLVTTRADKADLRKRLVSLTKKGKELANRMEPIWDEIRKATEDYVFEVEPDFLKIIDKLEDSYSKYSLYDRIKKGIGGKIKNNAEIVIFNASHKSDFRKLNLLWIEEYLGITDHDIKILNDPEKMIIESGGEIFLLKYEEEIVGCFALVPLGEKDCELCKFTVKHNFRGMGLGELLLQQALKEAANSGYGKTYLFSHENLKEATSLYTKSGFEMDVKPPEMTDPTGRCSFVMSFNNH